MLHLSRAREKLERIIAELGRDMQQRCREGCREGTEELRHREQIRQRGVGRVKAFKEEDVCASFGWRL